MLRGSDNKCWRWGQETQATEAAPEKLPGRKIEGSVRDGGKVDLADGRKWAAAS